MAAKMGSRSDLGLVIGKMASFSTFRDIGHMLLSCATVREALLCLAEFHPMLSSGFAMRVEKGMIYTEVSWVPIRPVPYDFVHTVFDIWVGAMDSMMATMLGDRLQSYDVHFTWPAPTHASLYKQLTRARCHFEVAGMLSLRMQFNNDILETPSLMCSPSDLTELRKRMNQRMAQTPGHGNWTAWVSMMLRESHGEQPTQDMLAALVQISGGTLARKLAGEGTSFRKLANEVRHQRACCLLNARRMMVSEISERLGYSDVSSFVRAFKAVSGYSPMQYAKLGLGNSTCFYPPVLTDTS